MSALGRNTIKHIYEFADILHCEPIAKVADGMTPEGYVRNLRDYDRKEVIF